MSTLVQAALTVRKTARASFGLASAGLFGILVFLGVFRVDPAELGLAHGAVSVAWLGVFLMRLFSRSRQDRQVLTDVELGLLLLTAMHAIVQLGGGIQGPLYPVVYVLVAFLASFSRGVASSVLIGAAIGFEAILYFWAEDHDDPETFLVHAVFLLLFGSLNLLFTRVEIARVRKTSQRQLDRERERVKDDARVFRLVSAASETAANDDERLFRSSLQEVHNALFHLLDMLRRTLELHTCVVLFHDEASDELRIVELATGSDAIAEGPFAVGSGAVGAVVKRKVTMNLEHLKPSYKGLCYYDEPAGVRSFVGIPVLDQDHVRGALCADRLEDRPFTARDEEILEGAIRQILRTLENERIFVQLERSKREQTVLYRASQRLGAAMTEDEVLDAGLEAAQEIAPFDFAAVTLYDVKKRRHTIRRAVGTGSDKFQSLSFRDNTSLTAMAVKNRHYLPYRGEYDAKQQVVYTKRANLKGMQSLLIMPLIVREDAIGTMALAAERKDAFGNALRPTLQLLANHVAVALANAAAVRTLEEMATTDGLTGCLNKRAFLQELDSKLVSAERFGRPLSLLVTDIDHFKSVNDTYGHATGDVVIKELGEILRRVKRETDVVARFGGEEFCVLCEETEVEGAILLAERIREELQATVFQTDLGKVQVTASVGVATFPADARTSSELFEITDQALYAAKRSGRNRVCTAADIA
ncbi:MAG: diguanylate cyclase [Myxococcota bacterium]